MCVEEMEPEETRKEKGNAIFLFCFVFALLAVFPRLIKPQIVKEISVSLNPKGKLEKIDTVVIF